MPKEVSSVKFLLPVILTMLVLSGFGLFIIYGEKADKTETLAERRPDFQMRDVDGNLQSMSQWDNQVVLINFWATWCPPCRKEIPDFIDVYEKYRDKGFIIVGIAIDNNEDVMNFIDTLGITYPVLVGENEAIQLTQRFGNQHGALPYSVLLDRSGKIIRKISGILTPEELTQAISPLL